MPDKKKKLPHPVLYALISWLSHSSSWSLIAGVVLGIVAAIVPRWTGMEAMVKVFDQLAILLPVVFTILAAGQKYADSRTDGRTSAFVRWHEKKEEEEAGGDS